MRFGVVPYLNAYPLHAALEGEKIAASPSRLLPQLIEDRVDVALLPVFDRFRIPGLAHVPGLMIGCDGPSETVLLHLAKPLAEARRIRLDPNSRSSNALLKILLAKKHAVEAEFVDGDADAWLTIGDASFDPSPHPTLDLGAEWKDWTGLPFVFALWTYRASRTDARAIVDAVTRARHASPKPPAVGGLDPERIQRYLTQVIRYDLGERETQGMDRFIALCREMKLL